MIFSILITVFLILLNGFFVAAEFAIVKVRFSQIELMAKSGNKLAKITKGILIKLDAYLSATQLGITIASLGLGFVGEKLFDGLLLDLFHYYNLTHFISYSDTIATFLAIFILTVLHVVFGELAPKSLALQKSEAVSLAVAYPLKGFYIVFKPLISLMNAMANLVVRAFGIHAVEGHEVHSPEELKLLVQQGKESGSIETANYEIIRNAFDFSDRSAKQVMVPRMQIMALNVDLADEAAIDKLIEEGYSRMPVFKDSLDNILGQIYVKDILGIIRKNKNFELKSNIRPVSFVYQNQKVTKLLRQFQRDRIHMAIVIDEYGGTLGIITMEDIMEELVGEIQDEYDNEVPIVEKQDDHTFKVLASAPIADLNEYLPRPLTERKEYDTLAGLLAFELDRIPNLNEKITFEEYEFTALKRTRSRLQLVMIKDLLFDAPKEEDDLEK